MRLSSPRDRRDKHLCADFASKHLEEVTPVVQAEEARSPDIEPVQTCGVVRMSCGAAKIAGGRFIHRGKG